MRLLLSDRIVYIDLGTLMCYAPKTVLVLRNR